MADAPYTTPSGTGGRPVGFNPLSPYDVAYLQQRGSTNSGVAWNAPVASGNFTSVPFNQTYGGQPAPYADLSAQILDAMQAPGRYAQSWPWGNTANRYNFGQSGAPQSAPAPQATPVPPVPPVPQSPPVLQAPPVTQPTSPAGFWPSPAAPAGTPPPTSLTPRPGGAQPQQQDGAYAYLLRKGYTPAAAQARVNYMASGPQQLSQWNALGSDTARGQFLNTHPGFAREMLNSGNMSSPQSTLYSLLALGSSGR